MEKEKTVKKSGLLFPFERYIQSGVHIGTRILTKDMERFVLKRREDGIYILDVEQIDKRLNFAINILARFKPEDILVVASRVYAANAASKFSQITGIEVIKGRFYPGTFTNPQSDRFREPKILFVSDPRLEKQAIIEAIETNIPVIALADTDNFTRGIDVIVPANNKGRKSLALIYYLLAREYMVRRKMIKDVKAFKYPVEFFEKLEEI